MHVRFFLRKPSPAYHSIEKLFYTIYKGLPNGLTTLHYAPFQSKGFLNRIRIGLDARKNQADINHITGDIHFIALFLDKKKTILTIHDIGSMKHGNLIKRQLIKLFWFSLPIKRVRFVTVISAFTYKEVQEQFNIKTEKLCIINNCISDIYQYHPKNKPFEKPVILQIGTKPNKNLLNLIRALYNIECKLYIVGELSKQQTNELNEMQIDYKNYINITNEELLELYIQCDILAYVSLYEGFGMPVVEANAVGRVVLASQIEPIISVADGAAHLVNPHDIAEIKQGIRFLLNNPEYCSLLVQKGIENAKKYRSVKIAGEYFALYQKMQDSL